MYITFKLIFSNKEPIIGPAIADTIVPIENNNENPVKLNPCSCITDPINNGCILDAIQNGTACISMQTINISQPF